MSEKFPGHGIVGPMGGPGPAAPDQIFGQNIPQKIRGQIIGPKIYPQKSDFIYTESSARPGSDFIYTKSLRAAGIRCYLHKLTQTYMLNNFPAARASKSSHPISKIVYIEKKFPAARASKSRAPIRKRQISYKNFPLRGLQS